MNDAVACFSDLGRYLRRFGTDARSRRIADEACRLNRWFTPSDIRRAVEAIATEMLQPDPLREWLGRYPVPVSAPRRVLVVMAGNMPLVGFFDLLCVLASGHHVVVKPSAKDSVLVDYVLDLLREADPRVPVERYEEDAPFDAVIATGSDNANRYFRARFSGMPALLRGSRQSVAVLSGCETPEQLAGLADDIWAYSGLGCRNVSLAFAPEDYELQLQMPSVNPKYVNNYRQEKALCRMTGRPFVDLGAALLIEQEEFPSALSCISHARYKRLSEVESWLAKHDSELQCVVGTCIAHSRRTDFGRSQSPSLTDYPDDRDVMDFLCGLTDT